MHQAIAFDTTGDLVLARKGEDVELLGKLAALGPQSFHQDPSIPFPAHVNTGLTLDRRPTNLTKTADQLIRVFSWVSLKVHDF